jgi:hypothetical protein
MKSIKYRIQICSSNGTNGTNLQNLELVPLVPFILQTSKTHNSMFLKVSS